MGQLVLVLAIWAVFIAVFLGGWLLLCIYQRGGRR